MASNAPTPCSVRCVPNTAICNDRDEKETGYNSEVGTEHDNEPKFNEADADDGKYLTAMVVTTTMTICDDDVATTKTVKSNS